MNFVGVCVCAEIIDSICQFMQKQLTQKAAEWMLFLPANTFTQLEKLRSVTVVLHHYFEVLGGHKWFSVQWLLCIWYHTDTFCITLITACSGGLAVKTTVHEPLPAFAWVHAWPIICVRIITVHVQQVSQ